MSQSLDVSLISYTPNPLESLYLAYRTCYSDLTPQEIKSDIDKHHISQSDIIKFIDERMKTGHTSPLEQVVFEFAISGISRACSHQLVRHRVGISIAQQSQRYVAMQDNPNRYILPPSIKERGLEDAVSDQFIDILKLYNKLLQNGIEEEDARYILPMAASTNIKLTINFAALLHLADIRLCVRTQWEFRHLVAAMRAEIMREIPLKRLGKYIQPKCGEMRQAYCDEDKSFWQICPLGQVRAHKSQAMINNTNNVSRHLREADFKSIKAGV